MSQAKLRIRHRQAGVLERSQLAGCELAEAYEMVHTGITSDTNEAQLYTSEILPAEPVEDFYEDQLIG